MVRFNHRLAYGFQRQRPEVDSRAAAIQRPDGPTTFYNEAEFPRELTGLAVVALRMSEVSGHHLRHSYLRRGGVRSGTAVEQVLRDESAVLLFARGGAVLAEIDVAAVDRDQRQALGLVTPILRRAQRNSVRHGASLPKLGFLYGTGFSRAFGPHCQTLTGNLT